MLGAEPTEGLPYLPAAPQSLPAAGPWSGVAGAEGSWGAPRRAPGAVSSTRMRSSPWQPQEHGRVGSARWPCCIGRLRVLCAQSRRGHPCSLWGSTGPHVGMAVCPRTPWQLTAHLQESWGELVTMAGSDCTRGNGFEVGECRLRAATGKRFLDRFPSEFVTVPSLEAFKARLDGAVSSLVSREVSLPAAGGWNEVISEAPSETNHSANL